MLYEIHIDNNGDGVADVTYQFTLQDRDRRSAARSSTTSDRSSRSRASTGTAASSTRHPSRATAARPKSSAKNLRCPPCNIGPLSTPNYASLAAAAVHAHSGGRKVFAGQRAEAFFVDLGSIFDLGDLRPIANLHATFGLPALAAAPGRQHDRRQ